MKKLICIIILSVQAALVAVQTPYKALVIVPIADLAGQSLQENSKQSVTSIYKNLSICGKQGEFACPRVHQALFHEYVTVLEERNQEVLVKVNNFFYETDKSTTKYDTFWSLKKNFFPIAQIKNFNAIEPLIAQPTHENKYPSQKNVTLLSPYKDPISGIAYSVGTRFVPLKKNNDHTIVHAFNPHNKQMYTVTLPTTIVAATQELTLKQRKALFVRLCRSWAHETKGLIPYVWGGCSLNGFYKTENFDVHKGKDHVGKPIAYFKKNETRHPHSGFDCAGLIARAAQTAGLPYYYKNSTTLSKHLPLHTKESALQEGDVIWIPGHVMVIGSLKKNTIIEARHYNHGYGKVHEIPLNEVFKDVHTFDQLKQVYLGKKQLLRLDKQKNVIQTLSAIKLLQMNFG